MPRCELDHLVIAAATLEQGADWLEGKLGVRIPPGGEHPLMGTHNRLMQIGNGAYLEIIAIDPGAPDPGRPRWFSLDEPDMRARIAREPALVTWVARTDDVTAGTAASPFPCGAITEGRRGAFVWRVTIPHDGSMPEDGLFPAQIQWPDFKGPARTLPDLGCRLEAFRIAHAEPEKLRAALAAIGANGIASLEQAGPDKPAGLAAVIGSPRGRVALG